MMTMKTTVHQSNARDRRTGHTAALPLLFCCLAFPLAAFAQAPAPQKTPTFTAVPGAFGYDLAWPGVDGRTYFLQFSEDLATWHFLPVVVKGMAADQVWWMNSSGQRFFTRLYFTDIACDDPWAADFDGDGLGNLFEVENGLNPFKLDTDGDGIPDGALDPDMDGLLNTSENNLHLDPAWKDNPALGLKTFTTQF